MARVDIRLGSALALALSLASSACGGGFDPPSEVKTLRVLGVQKDIPYPRPGDTVTLRLLYHDPLETPGSEATVTWLPGGVSETGEWTECFDPPGDLYFGCFPRIVSALTDPRVAAPVLDEGTQHSFEIKRDLFDAKPPPDPGQPSYALAFSFFAICAGELRPELPQQSGGLPLSCRDRGTGALLGPDRFIFGYVSLYVFEDGFANANPVLNGFEVSGSRVETSCSNAAECGACVNEACLDPDGLKPKLLQDPDCSDSGNPLCVAACPGDGDDGCPEISIRPLLDEISNAEPDDVSRVYHQRNVGEQLWINYYVDRGAVKSSARLLNDATTGWNADFGTKFYAPKEPGPVNVWAVVHDNRGGASWVALRLSVQ